ncbi:hypothetical protein M885DRAFT_504055 [Pelagophyceae sp. CCMP2097]|nr:hypothetical protein M885DRAFT_504055 [Pelagophyceae sp. CCMP2097]
MHSRVALARAVRGARPARAALHSRAAPNVAVIVPASIGSALLVCLAAAEACSVFKDRLPAGVRESKVLAKYQDLKTAALSKLPGRAAAPHAAETAVVEDAAVEAVVAAAVADVVVPASPAEAVLAGDDADELLLRLARLEAEASTRAYWEAVRLAEARKGAVAAADAHYASARSAAQLERQLLFDAEVSLRAGAHSEAVKAACAREDAKAAKEHAEQEAQTTATVEKERLADLEGQLSRRAADDSEERIALAADHSRFEGDECVSAMQILHDLDVKVAAAFAAAANAPADDAAARAAHDLVARALTAGKVCLSSLEKSEIVPKGLSSPSDAASMRLQLRERWRLGVLRAARVSAQTPDDLGVLGAVVGETVAALQLSKTPASTDTSDAASIERADAAVENADLADALMHLESVAGKGTRQVLKDWTAEARRVETQAQTSGLFDARAALVAASRANIR